MPNSECQVYKQILYPPKIVGLDLIVIENYCTAYMMAFYLKKKEEGEEEEEEQLQISWLDLSSCQELYEEPLLVIETNVSQRYLSNALASALSI